MSSARYTRSGIVAGGHTSDQVSRRAATIERVRALLTQQPQSCFDLAAVIGIPSGTLYGYLRYMEEEGEVFQMDHVDERGRKTWAIDSDAQQAATDRLQTEHSKRAWIVPARQMGMARDPLVAALFGAPQGAKV